MASLRPAGAALVPRCWTACALAVFSLGAAPQALRAQVRDTTTLRPTDVSLTITNSPRYSGSYQSSGISRICGTMDLGYPHRKLAFTVEFPDDEPNLAVRSLAFDADTLPIGATVRSFHLSVGITTPQGEKPADFVVRANRPQYKETGTATLQAKGGTATLTIDGTNDMGVGLTLSIVCRPRP